MTTTAEVTDLTLRLRAPLTLADVIAAARVPGTHGTTVAALLEKWLAPLRGEKPGDDHRALNALLCAPADELGDLVRDWSQHSCQACRTPLPDWVERVENDVPLSFCPSCAVADQDASPQDWREYMTSALYDDQDHDRG